MSSSGDIFGTANARLIEADRVGSSFVYSTNFRRAAVTDHNAILGPRGSGKTTLLKMLMLPALKAWKHTIRDELIEELGFVSAYIPATITWSADYRAFNARPMDEDASKLLSLGLFRHSVLSSLANLIDERRTNDLVGDSRFERFADRSDAGNHARLLRDLAELWQIEIDVSSVEGVLAAIRRQVRKIQKVSVEVGVKGLNGGDVLDRLTFIGANFLDDVDDFIAVFGESLGDLKVALCVDELEIASPEISDAILRAPRSINQRVLIKYSAAPYVSAAPNVRGPEAPSADNDYKLVYLSAFSTKNTKKFTESLFASISAGAGVVASPIEVLGSSFIEDGPDKELGVRYRIKGARQTKFRSLYEKDISFRNFIAQRNVDIENLEAGSENSRAADIRKIIWPVLVREEFLFSGSNVERQRQRRIRSKSPISDIYTGAGSLFAICEGNPRWIIGLLKPMISSHHERSGKSAKRSEQKLALEKMSAAYFALLSTIPSISVATGPQSLLDLIDIVGLFFQRSVLGPEFNADPVLSFEVDMRITAGISDLVGRGLNVGAFVSSPKVTVGHSYHPGEIFGLKVRLTNLLAPHYRLPLIGGRTLPLSTILARQAGRPFSSSLGNLFGDLF